MILRTDCEVPPAGFALFLDHARRILVDGLTIDQVAAERQCSAAEIEVGLEFLMEALVKVHEEATLAATAEGLSRLTSHHP